VKKVDLLDYCAICLCVPHLNIFCTAWQF